MIQEAVILAGGRSKRMKETAKIDLPKPLIALNNRPIISYNIESLLKVGIQRIIIVIRRENENLFKEYLKNYSPKITFCYQEINEGTAAALFCAKDYIESDLFLTLMGDDIIIDDFERIIKVNKPTVFGFEIDNVINYGCLLTDGNFLLEIVEKKIQGKGLANTGMYIMCKEFFKIFKKIKPDEKSGEYFLTEAPKILKEEFNIKFYVDKVKFWLPINTYEELRKAKKVIDNLIN